MLLIDALRLSSRGLDAVRVSGRYRRHLREETGLDPGAALVAAEQRALAGDVEPPDRRATLRPAGDEVGATRGEALPRATRRIGRDVDVAELTAALASGRLVTICGPGGVGKTRLAAEITAQRPNSGRVIVVELAAVTADEVLAAVAGALHLRGDRASRSTIAEHLHDVDALLVVDNAEHVTDEVRALTRTLVDRCPRLRILVTSRARLDLPDEHVHVLAPLPTTGERSPAVELFTERLTLAGRQTVIDDAERRWICTRLDGLPLALELAAGRAAVLGPAGLRDRLDTALRPPSFDAPETVAFHDETSSTLFAADSFGALLHRPAADVADIAAGDLVDGMGLWSTIDSPWVTHTDRDHLTRTLHGVRGLNAKRVLSSHLPPAIGFADTLVDNLAAVPGRQPWIGPDQAALEQVLATVTA